MTLVEKLMIRPPSTKPFGCFAQAVESALQIHGNEAVKRGVIRSGDARQGHDPGVVDQNVDAAELFFSSVEQARYLDRFADIGLRADRAPFVRVDFLDERRSFRLAACIVHYDGEAVLRQSAGDGAADAAGCPGYDGSLG